MTKKFKEKPGNGEGIPDKRRKFRCPICRKEVLWLIKINGKDMCESCGDKQQEWC